MKENRIVEEWLVRDELSIARQLGLDEAELVKAIAEGWAALKGPESDVQGAVERSKGQLPPEPLPPPTAEGFDIEDFVRRAWHDIWNRRMFSEIFRLYAPTFECHSASGRELYGQDDAMQFVLDWLAAFPDARMFIDHFASAGQRGDRLSRGGALDLARHARRPRHLRPAHRQARPHPGHQPPACAGRQVRRGVDGVRRAGADGADVSAVRMRLFEGAGGNGYEQING